MKTPPATASFETLVAEYPALAEWVRLADEKTRLLEAERDRDREMIAFLQGQLEELKRLIFGMKSERFVPDVSDEQMALFAGAPVVVETPVAEERVVTVVREKKNKPVRQVLSASIPRKVIVIEPDVDLTGLKRIGEEITETLDRVPGYSVVIRRVRPKYIDPNDESRGVIMAPLPARPIDKGMAEPGLLASVVIDKFVDHIPVYRQVERFRREGLTLSESTLGDWISSTADLLGPLYDALIQEARASGYLQADETPLQVLREKSKMANGPIKRRRVNQGSLRARIRAGCGSITRSSRVLSSWNTNRRGAGTARKPGSKATKGCCRPTGTAPTTTSTLTRP